MSKKEDYLVALKKEMVLQSGFLKGEKINTIYFGGGTPSMLSFEELNPIIESIFSLFEVIEHPEITLEANPEDIDVQWIKNLLESKINRISVGIQSFNSEILQRIGRKHSAEKAISALKLLIEYGFNNLTADLIYGIPGQTNSILEKDLQTLIQLKIPHISAYALTVEEKTPLSLQIKKALFPQPDENQMTEQFYLVKDALEKMGYEHYEISNYGLAGHQAKHNVSYWMGEKYLGLGPSAHSYNGKIRKWNVSNVHDYILSIQKGILPCEFEEISKTMQLNEYILTRLRTQWGINLKEIQAEYGEMARQHIVYQSQKPISEGLFLLENDTIRLSRKGMLLTDRLSAGLFMD